jgi:hypothetical protein
VAPTLGGFVTQPAPIPASPAPPVAPAPPAAGEYGGYVGGAYPDATPIAASAPYVSPTFDPTPLGGYSPTTGYEMPAWKPDLTDLAIAQKAVIYAILLNLVAFALRFVVLVMVLSSTLSVSGGAAAIALISTALGWIATILSLWGVFQMTGSLGYATGLRVLFFLLMFVPLVSLIVLLVLSAQATSKLRAAGYTVGLMGATT